MIWKPARSGVIAVIIFTSTCAKAATEVMGDDVATKQVLDSMDKLHGASNFVNFAAYSWNIFRYIGDYLHLGGILTLLVTIVKNKSVAGISRTTQILYCIVFCTRYLDLFDHTQSFYLVFFKLTYIVTSIIVLFCFYQFDSTYARRHDTCNMTIILVPCTVAALLLTSDYSLLEVLWTFSEFIEGFAMAVDSVFFQNQCRKRPRAQ
eukprot:s2490_g1.t1